MTVMLLRDDPSIPASEWALIEAPIPNAPEAKYISQIPSPNNLLTIATALQATGVTDFALYNFLKQRKPPMLAAANIVYNMGEATCMDYLYNYSIEYLAKLRHFNADVNIWLTGNYAWLHGERLSADGYKVPSAHYFESDISGAPKHGEYHNDWGLNDWAWMHENVASVTKGVRATLRASRGCPHKCAMCPVLTVYGGVVRRYSVDWVMSELETLYDEHNVRQIGFLDDNLCADRSWAKELCRRIIDRNFKCLSLTFEEGLDVPTALDEELLGLLKRARFTHLKLGVESLQPETLRFIRKPYRDPELAIKAIKLLQQYKLSPVCFVCIGFPTDTEEGIRDTLAQLKRLNVKLRVQVLWAYPGVNFQGKGVPEKTLKALQQDAMYDTNSTAWRRRPASPKMTTENDRVVGLFDIGQES